MKRFIACFLLCLLMIQSQSNLWIKFAFHINRDFVAQNLCVNKSDPQSTCKGSCQLKKQLKEHEDKSEQSGIDKKTFEMLFIVKEIVQLDDYFFSNSKSTSTFFPVESLSHFNAQHFHPPSFYLLG